MYNMYVIYKFILLYINHNFSAWGDGVFLGLQTLAIAVLVMYYNKQTTKATAFLFAYIAIVFAVNSGATPVHVLWACQALNIPIILISKVYDLIFLKILLTYIFLMYQLFHKCIYVLSMNDFV